MSALPAATPGDSGAASGSSANSTSNPTVERIAAQLRKVRELKAALLARKRKKAGRSTAGVSLSAAHPRSASRGVEPVASPPAPTPSEPPPQPVAPVGTGQQGDVKWVGMFHKSKLPQGVASVRHWTNASVVQWASIRRLGSAQFFASHNNIDGVRLLALGEADFASELPASAIQSTLAAIESLRVAQTARSAPTAVVGKRPAPGVAMASSAATPPTKRARHGATNKPWIGTVESWILEHDKYCPHYKPGGKQTRMGGYLCCGDITPGASYDMVQRKNANSCCGVTDLIVLRNNSTGRIVGSLPCAMTEFLAPLVDAGLVQLSGATTRVIHPEGGVPPFELIVHADLIQLVALKQDPAYALPIKKLKCLLENWEGDWITSRYPQNVGTVRQLLNHVTVLSKGGDGAST